MPTKTQLRRLFKLVSSYSASTEAMSEEKRVNFENVTVDLTLGPSRLFRVAYSG